MLSRRQVVTNGMGLAVIAGIGGVYLGSRWVAHTPEVTIAKIIGHYLADREIAPKAAEDFAQVFAPISEVRWQQSAMLASHTYFLPAMRGALPGDRRLRLEQIDRAVVSEFLLASTFDPADDDPEKPLEFVALATDRVCNPFARFAEG